MVESLPNADRTRKRRVRSDCRLEPWDPRPVGNRPQVDNPPHDEGKDVMKLQLTLTALMMVSSLAAQNVSPADLLLQEARHKQQVEGDLDGAIKLYKQIVNTKTGGRAVVANALLGLADCYEKQGKLSEGVYRQIVQNYGDQAAAAEARRKLAALRPPAPAPVMAQHKMELPAGVPPGMTDGQRAIYRDAVTGDLVISDLAGRNKRVVFPKPKNGAFSFTPSRDLSLVELLVYSPGPGRQDRHAVIKADGTGYREFALLGYVSPRPAWSWDSRHLLYIPSQTDGTARLVSVSVPDGQIQEVLRLDNTTILTASFSPDGRFIAYAASGGATLDRVFVVPSQGGEPQLISDNATFLDWTRDGRYLAVASPHSGVMALDLLPVKDGKPAGEPVFVRYGSFESGHTTPTGALLYSSAPHGGPFLSWISELNPDGRPGDWKRINFGSNFRLGPLPRWSPESSEIAWTVTNDDTGQAEYVVRLRNPAAGKERDVYRAPDVTLCVWAARRYSLFCSEVTNGGTTTDILSIGADSGHAERLGTVQGAALLLAARNDDQAVYFGRPRVGLMQWDIGTRQETLLEQGWVSADFNSPLPSPDGVWLKRISNGNLEARRLSGGDWKPVLPLRSGNQSGFSPDGKWIFYHDVDAAGRDGLYRVAPGGGGPERLGDFPTDRLNGRLTISPDGRKIIAQTTDTAVTPEIWMLENFEPKVPVAK